MKPKLLLLSLLFLLISVISISCDDYVVHKINKTITDSFSKQDKKMIKEFTSITIDFAKIKIELPKYYFKTNHEELTSIIDFIDENTQIQLNNIKEFEKSNKGFIIFVDSNNVFNQIMIFGAEHTYFDKKSAGQYLYLLERQLENEWIPRNINYTRLESNYLSNSNVRILKVKYETNINNITNYTTQYIITTAKKSFSIVVNNSTNEDFQKNIAAIKLF
ncbi:MAG: hypothetical protein K0B10_04915 [Vicingaceae bacterium]|nr:hypothetical protein [Vicingaceae bacterium]